MTTRSMAAHQGSQKNMEPETVVHVPSRKRSGRGMGNQPWKFPLSGRRLILRGRPRYLQGKIFLPWETCLRWLDGKLQEDLPRQSSARCRRNVPLLRA